MAEEKRALFDRAIAEYKESIRHYERFAELFGELGISMCPNFYKHGENAYDLHIFEGLKTASEIAEKAVVDEGVYGDYYRSGFDHDGLYIFELSEDGKSYR